MQEARDHPVSLEVYFQLDAESEARLEYWGGRVVAMAGESRNHAVVKDDVIRWVERQRPDGLALTAGLRVYAPGYGRQNYAYPDGLLVCGEERYDDNQPPTLLNPTLLLEVTSPTTKSADFDDKFGAYFKTEPVVSGHGCKLSLAKEDAGMATLVNVHEAKTQLSKLLRRVEAGEDIIIGRAGEPVARLTRFTPDDLAPRPLGTWRGQVEIADDFDALPDEIVDAFYTSKIEPDTD